VKLFVRARPELCRAAVIHRVASRSTRQPAENGFKFGGYPREGDAETGDEDETEM
jgi:hypothetical protein